MHTKVKQTTSVKSQLVEACQTSLFIFDPKSESLWISHQHLLRCALADLQTTPPGNSMVSLLADECALLKPQTNQRK